MAKAIRIEALRDFTGGLNLRSDAFELAPNESPDLLNCDVDPRGGVQMRKGVQPYDLIIGNPNLLTQHQASLEDSALGTTGWGGTSRFDNVQYADLARSTAWAAQGSASLELTARDNATDQCLAETDLFPVQPSTQYSALITSRAVTTTRSSAAYIRWFDSSRALISGATGTSLVNDTATDTPHGVTATSPANAAYACLGWSNSVATAVGEKHRIDKAHFAKGANTTAWLSPEGTNNPNLLTMNEASVETDATGWRSNSNCTVARATAQSADGAASLFVTASSAADMRAETVRRIPVTGGKGYAALANARAATTARNCRTRIDWYRADNTFISSSNGNLLANTATGWTSLGAIATAPFDAVSARVVVEVQAPASGEAHYVDKVQLTKGHNASVWISPANTTSLQLDGEVLRVFRFEKPDGTKQLVLITPTTLWYMPLGGYETHAIATFRDCRAAMGAYASGGAYVSKLYLVAGAADRRSASWDGAAFASLGETYNDNVQTPNRGDVPKARHIAYHLNCLWIAYTREDGVDYPNRVRFSHPGQPEDWRTADYIDIDVGADGDKITGLVPFGDRLYVFKRRSVYAITGASPDTFAVYPVSREVGAISADAIATSDVGLYFFSWPEGVMRYTGKDMRWEFERIVPAIHEGQVPASVQSEIKLGWSGRRLWVTAPYQATLTDPVPTRPTRVFVLDPTLTKDGSWVAYDLKLGAMFELNVNNDSTIFLGGEQGAGRLLVLDTAGVADAAPFDEKPYDTFFVGGVKQIASHYRTRWIDVKQPAVAKRWKSPEFVLAPGANEAVRVKVEAFVDFDPYTAQRTFTLTTSMDGGTFTFGSGAIGTSVLHRITTRRAQLLKGQALGTARAISLKLNGPSTSKAWGLNQVSAKYIPKKVRS